MRPCRAYGRERDVDVVVVRMNHEDLYAGIEYAAEGEGAARLRALVKETEGIELSDDTGITLKPISTTGARRLARFAFEYALSGGRKRVTAVHKATVMRCTDGLFRDAVLDIAREYPAIEVDERLVDAACHDLVARPGGFDVLVLPMLYGDVVSDIGAALIGGLGMAPGANVGDHCAVFEAVHGTALKYAGQERANPLALVLSGAMLLRHLDEHAAADRVEQAVAELVAQGRVVTFDLRPGRDRASAASTSEVATALVEHLSGS